MAEKKMPVIYEIVLKKFVDKVNDDKRLNSNLSINDITKILSVIFHIPKEYHYAVLKEFESFGVLKIERNIMRLIGKEARKI